MKITNFFLVALLSTALFSCSNNDEDPDSGQDARTVLVTINGLSDKNLKSSDPVDAITTTTMDVNSIRINLTDNNGTVIASKLVTKDTNLDSDWDKLITPGKGLKFINTPKAVSKVYVYGNPKTAVDASNIIATNLANQQGSEVLYYGVDEDLTPIQDEPISPDPTIGKTYTANVIIAPIMARLQIKTIKLKTSGPMTYKKEVNGVQKSATINWTNFTANLKGIYLNNVFYKYNKPGTLEDFMHNMTIVDNLKEGMWIFTNPALDAAAFASYNKWNTATLAYDNMPFVSPINTPDKCYAFNFFPGTAIPKLHIDVADVVATGLTSSDTDVFNPLVITNPGSGARFANVVKFYKAGNIEMVASDFVAGRIYNMDIELTPPLDTDLVNTQYNVIVHVTIAPWTEETITPGFEYQ